MTRTYGNLILELGLPPRDGIMPTRAAAPITSAHPEETRPWQSS